MKKKLLLPPQKDGQILFLPKLTKFLSSLKDDATIGTAHQPYFFHPGIALKFIFLDMLNQKNKKFVFVDTDRIELKVNIPLGKEDIYTKGFIKSDNTFFDHPAPPHNDFIDFFDSIKEELKNASFNSKEVISNVEKFKGIVMQKRKKLLKEVLADAFLDYCNIKQEYAFISDVIDSKEYRDFFINIYDKDDLFRKIFNSALEEYKEEYRFRYKNFPFPRLEEDELPFWIMKEGKRERCFKKDIDLDNLDILNIFPRASTLTLFLRLYVVDIFIHGVGGANYAWVNDRIIERFFKRTSPPYGVLSATFLIGKITERDLPYFFYNPEDIRRKLDDFLNP